MGALGNVFAFLRKWDSALERHQKAIAGLKDRDEQHKQIGLCYHQIGMVHQLQRAWPQAIENYQKAIECFERTGQKHELPRTLICMALVEKERKNGEEACRFARAALLVALRTDADPALFLTILRIASSIARDTELAGAAQDDLNLALNQLFEANPELKEALEQRDGDPSP